MTTCNPLPTVQRMFEAFANRDLDALVDVGASRFALDTLVPIRAQRRAPTLAKAALGSSSRTFFGGWISQPFQAREFVTENDTVVVFGFESGTVKTTGDPFRNEWTQKYAVRSNLITEMEEYNIQVTGPRSRQQSAAVEA